ncbi:hypothetical protein U1Q18_046522, partial [Sarracenia purpurea var. burkii]
MAEERVDEAPGEVLDPTEREMRFHLAILGCQNREEGATTPVGRTFRRRIINVGQQEA